MARNRAAHPTHQAGGSVWHHKSLRAPQKFSSRADPMLRAFRDFLDTFLPQAKRLLDPFGALQIVHQDDNKLILKNNIRQFEFNKRYRTVRSGTRVVAQFDVIKVIRVTHVGVENGPDYWAVALRLKGALLSVIVGHASDAVDAAIVASRIGTITGKQVRSS